MEGYLVQMGYDKNSLNPFSRWSAFAWRECAARMAMASWGNAAEAERMIVEGIERAKAAKK